MVGVDNFGPVLAALSVMQSNVQKDQKTQAHKYLESFQKSVRVSAVYLLGPADLHQREAWTITHSILANNEATVEAKLFAATTLKGKV